MQNQICNMFDRISPTYDRVNHILSFGLDLWWRKKAVSFLPQNKSLRLLDLATGTGDQLLAVFKKLPIEEAIGLDFAKEMLEIGQKKIDKTSWSQKCHLVVGNATSIPYPEDNFDAITISFGIRNVSDTPLCLREMYRVLKKNGRAVILEFSLPKNRFLLSFHLFYLRKIVPFLGGLFSKQRSAYAYLNTTIESYPSGDAFLTFMTQAGFKNVFAHPLTFGIVTLYVGEK